jgi:hypothetical protein
LQHFTTINLENHKLAQDAEAAIGDLPAGLTVGVSVTARNAAGESQPTDNVQIVVP